MFPRQDFFSAGPSLYYNKQSNISKDVGNIGKVNYRQNTNIVRLAIYYGTNVLRIYNRRNHFTIIQIYRQFSCVSIETGRQDMPVCLRGSFCINDGSLINLAS